MSSNVSNFWLFSPPTTTPLDQQPQQKEFLTPFLYRDTHHVPPNGSHSSLGPAFPLFTSPNHPTLASTDHMPIGSSTSSTPPLNQNTSTTTTTPTPMTIDAKPSPQAPPPPPFQQQQLSPTPNTSPQQQEQQQQQQQAQIRPTTGRFSPLELMLFGGISGCVAKTLIAPADNIKILFQVNPQNHFTLKKAASTASQIVKDHGPLALWRGNSATLLRVFPYASINYTSHEFYFHTLQPFMNALPLLSSLSSVQQDGITRFLAGGLAGTTSTLITYPLDVFRARLAASIHAQHPGCSTYSGTVKNVINTLGVKGMFSGLTPTLLGIFPYNGISFATFHTLKRLYINNHHQENGTSSETTPLHPENIHENRLPVLVHLTCGGVAALIGQSLTYPLDVVRRRKQVGSIAQLSVAQSFKYIYQHEGLYGFFRGLSMNYLKGPISIATSFFVNDRLKYLAETHKSNKFSKVTI